MNKLNVKVVSATLIIFAGIVYLLCIAFQPVFPTWQMYTTSMWASTFPGFSWTLGGILLGLVESLLYGLFAGIIFAAIYNFSVNLFAPKATTNRA
ncbi:MAG TPA: DUF5676 family membrane protein [Bacteroidales bacterium]|nr:DUF5676 family membrane protein [Bacteroidales bacterium]